MQAQLTPLGQTNPRRALPEGSSTPDQKTLRTIEHERNAVRIAKFIARWWNPPFVQGVGQRAQMTHYLR